MIAAADARSKDRAKNGIDPERDIVDVYKRQDCGCYEVWNRAVPSAYDGEGSQLFVAERLRKEGIRLPFLVQGKLNNPNIDVYKRQDFLSYNKYNKIHVEVAV